jgi:hypothetical protein
VTGPTWLADSLAVVMATMAVYCASRIVMARRQGLTTEPDVDLVHVAMGGGMAFVLLHAPGAHLSRLGVASFAVAGAYFLARSARRFGQHDYLLRGGAHHVQHALGSGAMIFMFLPPSHTMASMPSMPGMAMPATAAHTGVPGLAVAAGVLAVLLAGFALVNVRRIVSATPASPQLLTPRLALCCQAVMSMTMCYMLLLI